MRYLLIILAFVFSSLKGQVILTTANGIPLTCGNSVLAKDMQVLTKRLGDTIAMTFLSHSTTPLTMYWGDGTSTNYSILTTGTAMYHKYTSSNTYSPRLVCDLSKIKRVNSAGTTSAHNRWGINLQNFSNLTQVAMQYGNDSWGDLSMNPINYMVAGGRYIMGNISNWTGLTYLYTYDFIDNRNNQFFYGGVDKLTVVTMFGLLQNLTYNNIYGDITKMVNLGYFYINYGSNFPIPSTLITLTKCGYFISPSNWVIPTITVNQFLADFWENRDIAKNSSNTERSINLSGAVGTGAPSGQGITDKTNLGNYRSPLNQPQYSLWTVTTR